MDKLKEYLPLISVIVIGLGFVRLNSYYSYFGVRIIDYIQVTEILTSFLDSLMTFSMIIGGIVAYAFIGDVILSQKEKPTFNSLKKLLGIKNETDKINELKQKRRDNFRAIFSAFILAAFSTLIASKESESDEIFKIWLFVIGSILAYFLLIFISAYVKVGRNFKIIFSGALIFVIVYFTGKLDAVKTKLSFDKEYYVVKYGDTAITTNKHLIYLGKTDKYFFIYNDSLNSYYTQPNETLKKITYVKRK